MTDVIAQQGADNGRNSIMIPKEHFTLIEQKLAALQNEQILLKEHLAKQQSMLKEMTTKVKLTKGKEKKELRYKIKIYKLDLKIIGVLVDIVTILIQNRNTAEIYANAEQWVTALDTITKMMETCRTGGTVINGNPVSLPRPPPDLPANIQLQDPRLQQQLQQAGCDPVAMRNTNKKISRHWKKIVSKMSSGTSGSVLGGITAGLGLSMLVAVAVIAPWAFLAAVVLLPGLAFLAVPSKNGSTANSKLLKALFPKITKLSELEKKRGKALKKLANIPIVHGEKAVDNLVDCQTCCICLSAMDCKQRHPVTTDNSECRHVFCYECANEVLKRANGDAPCPLCLRHFKRLQMVCFVCQGTNGGTSLKSCAQGHTYCDKCLGGGAKCPACKKT